MREIPIKQISDLLEIVADKLPKLANEMMHALYSEGVGTQMGKEVANMYKELTGAGIPREEALRMTKDYMNLMQSLAKVIRES
ncbi:hypothetical protein [Paenibacillus sp. Soil787]|uniref:hypothetical protein n=1 Tax=Paenibacillus sp. Soil787 TaxID=1736411 RepID=UPI00070349E6|nr:hypothetical protein [Paenibacillus sp. Soil787]KRF22539.1 hypothetical protein ASG93_29940 [Paenibacillus sp. Soil787]